jgi:hypothetical protein
MTDSTRSDAGSPAATVDSGLPDAGAAPVCTRGPNVAVADGLYRDQDASRGFQFAMPTDYMVDASKKLDCGDYPSLRQIVAEPNRQPRVVTISATAGVFVPRNLQRSVNGAGVEFYMAPSVAQETGQTLSWYLAIPNRDWSLEIWADATGKARLEAIAASFRWLR